MKNLLMLWNCMALGLTLSLTSCATYGEMHQMLADIEVLSEAELAQEFALSLTADQRERLVEDLVDLPEELEQVLQEAEEDLLVLTVGEWHDIVLAIRKDQVRNEERYDGKGPLAEILIMLLVELEEAGYPHMRHPTAVRWQKDHLIIKENLSTVPSEAWVRVVDQDGESLDGVILVIDKSYHPPWRWEATSQITSATVNGEKTIGVTGAFLNRIRLEARKEGYYTARRSIGPPRRDNVDLLIEQAWADVVLGRETVIAPEQPDLMNVVLELRKKGEIVDLYWFRAYAEIRGNGSGRILRLEPPGNSHPGMRIQERDGITLDVDDIESFMQEDAGLRDIIFLTEFEEGKVRESEQRVRGSTDHFYPKEMQLWTGDPEGGFQLSEEQEYRLMVKAPDDGYEQILSFEFTDIESEVVWYYFKVDGHYGKMRLGTSRVLETTSDLTGVRYQMNLFMNPTPGNRNLEDGK